MVSKQLVSTRTAVIGVFSLLSLFTLLTLATATPLQAQRSTETLQQATADPTVDAAAEADKPDETAEATPEVEVTPQPTVDVSTFTAEIVQTYDLVGGPTSTGAYIAPDGEKFVYVKGDEICLYTLDGEEQHCSPLEDEVRRLDLDSVTWSRDSRYVAFALSALIYFIDSDIWVYDTEENTLTNATPDDTLRLEMGKLDEGGHTIDLSPRWTDDGRLWFVRLKSNTLGDVMSIDPDGENPEVAYKYLSIYPYQYYLLDVTRDGSAIALTGYVNTGAATVLYENLADKRSRSIRLPEPFGPSMITFSPDGQYLLLLDGYTMSQFRDITNGSMHVIDVATSRLRPVDVNRQTLAAGWLPNQSSLVYTTFDPELEDIGLFIAGTPGEPGEKILDGNFFVPTSRNYQPIWISEQNTMLLTNRDNDLNIGQIALTADAE